MAGLLFSASTGSHVPLIPPGSIIEIRNNQQIFALVGSEGITYRASLTRHIKCCGVSAPAGSPAELVVLPVGRNRGGQLQLGLASIRIHGRYYQVRQRNLAGGPLGTMKGFIPAAGKHLGTEKIITKGATIQVPPEIIMIFKTDEPMYLY